MREFALTLAIHGLSDALKSNTPSWKGCETIIAVLSLFCLCSSAYLTCKCSCNLAASLSQITKYRDFSLEGDTEFFEVWKPSTQNPLLQTIWFPAKCSFILAGLKHSYWSVKLWLYAMSFSVLRMLLTFLQTVKTILARKNYISQAMYNGTGSIRIQVFRRGGIDRDKNSNKFLISKGNLDM